MGVDRDAEMMKPAGVGLFSEPSVRLSIKSTDSGGEMFAFVSIA